MSAVIPIECEMYGWDSPECNYLINEPALTFGADIPMDYRFSQQQVDELLRGEMVIDYEWMSFDRAARNLVFHEQIMCSVDPCVGTTKTFSIDEYTNAIWSIPAFADLRYALLRATQTPDDGYIDLCEFEPMNCCPEGTSWNDSAHKCLPILPPIILPNFVTFPDDRLIDLIHGQVIWNDDNSVGVYFDRYVNLLDIINRFDSQTFSLDDSTLLNAPGYIVWRDKFKALISKEESVCESQGLVSDAYGRCKTPVEPMIGDSCEARGYRTAANGDCEIFSDIEIERLLRGERIAPVMAMGDSELVYDAARNVLIVYRPGTDVVLAEQSLDDPKLDPRFQVFKEAAQSSGGTGLIIAAVAGLLLLSNRR